MTANIKNQNRVKLSRDNDANKALAINPAGSPKVESAGTMQKNGQRRESFLGALQRAFSSVAF
jgi:hypothetical protein